MEFYRTEVISLGEHLGEFTAEGVLVFFGKEAPEELQEHSVVHTHASEPTYPLEVGNTIDIDGNRYSVRAVGVVANKNLRNLGHLVLKFNGLSEAEMDGDVNVDATPLPQLRPGSILTIHKGD